MENIGGEDNITKGIVTVRWSFTDDEGQLHTKKFNNGYTVGLAEFSRFGWIELVNIGLCNLKIT